ncbi:hypothetical protein MH117_22330 [Paenibacillus sp. ACRRX]|uniref:hypothetical protein n=1 Tax=Paenibacillus sp. ACRRX TaxID=2918206 RepID=UPI001EF65119|nr:hypothetical protein [Paenibacillus sp. ACRRX]MCG7410156.1 hypothetical protein [Paenibacillus sp. ACRRX]
MRKKSEQDVIAALKNYPVRPINQQELEATIKGATGLLSRTELSRRASFGEFYIAQLRFINWRVWVIQLLVIIGIGGLSYNSVYQQQGNIQLIMFTSIAAPLLLIVGIPTLTRSLRYQMMDIELSTHHLLEKLTLVRISLLGMADLIGLGLLAGLMSIWMQMGFAIMLLYLLVPFNLTCLGCLWLLNRLRIPNCGYYCLIYSSFVALVQTILAFNPSLSLYHSSAIGVWQTLLLLTIIGIAFEVSELRKTCRNLETASRVPI